MCSSYTTKSKTNKEVYEKNYGKPWLTDDLGVEEKYHDASGEDVIGYPGTPMPVITKNSMNSAPLLMPVSKL